MAGETVFTPASPQAVKRWSDRLTIEILGRLWYDMLIGNDPERSVVQMNRDVERAAGDIVKVDLLMNLNGAGVAGENPLRDSEEPMDFYQDEVAVDELVNAAAYRTMSQQRTVHSIRRSGSTAAANWYRRVIEKVMMACLTGYSDPQDTTFQTLLTNFAGATPAAPDAAHEIDNSQAGGTPASFSVDHVTWAREKAVMSDPIVPPVELTEGEWKYVMFLHPYQVTSMKTEAGSNKWREITAVADARRDNRVYKSALGEWDGVILYESRYAPKDHSLNNTNYAVLCGASAGQWAFGRPYSDLMGTGAQFRKQPYFTLLEDRTDYNRRHGVGAGSIWGFKATEWNSARYGTITVATEDAPAA